MEFFAVIGLIMICLVFVTPIVALIALHRSKEAIERGTDLCKRLDRLSGRVDRLDQAGAAKRPPMGGPSTADGRSGSATPKRTADPKPQPASKPAPKPEPATEPKPKPEPVPTPQPKPTSMPAATRPKRAAALDAIIARTDPAAVAPTAVPPPTLGATPMSSTASSDPDDTGSPPSPDPSPSAGSEATRPTTASTTTREADRSTPTPPPTQPPPADKGHADDDPPTRRNWEWLLGTRGLTWAGIVILFLSFAFFLGHAIKSGWIGPEMRVIGVAIAGGALLGGGWWALRAKMAALGQGLLSGGIATWYLTVCAAYKPGMMVVDQALIGPGTAFTLLFMVVAIGLGIALRWNMQLISLAALIGGFAAPVLTSTGSGNQHLLFGYLLMLDAGVIGAALYRRWRALDLTAFAGTAILFAAWFAKYHPAPGAPWSTLVWLGAIGATFAVLPLLPHWRARSPVAPERIALSLGNIAFTFGYAALLLSPAHNGVLAALCFGAAAGYQGLGRYTMRRCGHDERLRHGINAISLMLGTLGLFYLLPVNAVATGWAVEAVLLVALGYRYGYAPARAVAPAVWGLALIRTLWELPIAPAGAAWLWHPAALHLLALPLAAIAIAVVHRRHEHDAGALDRLVAAGATVLAAVGLCVIGWHDWSRVYPSLTGPGVWGGAQWQIALGALVPAMVGLLALVAERLRPCQLHRYIAAGGTGLGLLLAVAAALVQPETWPLVNPHTVIAATASAALSWLCWRHWPRLLPVPGLAFALLVGMDLALWFGHDLGPAVSAGWFAFGPLAYAAVIAATTAHHHDRTALAFGAWAWVGAVLALGISYTDAWPDALPVLNLRAAAALIAVALPLWAARLLTPDARAHLAPSLATAAAIWGLAVFSCEVPLWCLRELDPAEAVDAARFALSASWLAYAALLLAVGFARRIRAARLSALALFALCAGKLLLIDLAGTETLVRIGSFCATGLVLIGASWLYHKLERRLDDAPETETDHATAEGSA